MKNLFYRPENAWVGDLIPYYDNGTYYAFYLHDPRIYKDQYAEDTTWHLAATKDFINVNYEGEAIKRGGDNEPNKNIYTGSIIKDKDNVYHAFYTAYNEDYKVNGKSVQAVMQAVGGDLNHLETVPDFIYNSDGSVYEEFDWRDPYVFWNEEEECYYMLLASRIKDGGELRGGCVSLSKSKDLMNWEYAEPFYYPEMYITMECPEVFKMGDYWYLVFSTFSDRFTTHFRYSKSLKGPWIIPEDDVFDTRANYAIKTASDGERRFAFGWIASKKGETDFGPWDWGGTMVFHEIRQKENSPELYVAPVDGMKDFHKKDCPINSPVTYNGTFKGQVLESETLGAVLYDSPVDRFSLECTFEVMEGTEFGIALHTDEGMEKGYFLRMNPHNNLVAWDMWPRTNKGHYQWQIAGDMPYQIETQRMLPKADKFDVLLVRENDICVLYINNQVALSTRMYDHKGGKLGIYVVQGKVKVSSLAIKE